MACIYIINGKEFSEINKNAINELLEANLIEPINTKTIAMAYNVAKQDGTNQEFTEKVEEITNDTNTEKQLPPSNSGTQVTEPVNKESEDKVEAKPKEEKPQSGIKPTETAETEKTIPDKVLPKEKELDSTRKIELEKISPTTTFREWESNAVSIENIEVDMERDRSIYVLPNNITVIEQNVMPRNVFKPSYSTQILDLLVKTTKKNKELLKKYNGIIDEDWGYTADGFGLPVFNSMEDAFNFAKEQGGNFLNKNFLDSDSPTTENIKGETAETVTKKETKTDESPVFDDKNKTNEVDSEKLLAPFVEVINNSKTVDEAFEKVSKIKDVQQETADEFSKTYNPSGNKSQKEAFADFYNKVKGSEKGKTTDEKIASAEKSINDIRNKLKEKFKVNLPEGTQTKGFTMNELIDVIADTAIQIAKTGIEINEAIKQAIQFLKEEGDLEGFDETEIFDKAKEAVMTDKEKATAKVEILDADQKMLVDDITIAENDEETIQGVKGFIDSMNRAKGLTQEEKDAMNERLGRNYEVLSNEKLELIGKTIIEELGGLDKALLEAQNAKSDLLPYMKTFILGQAILENKKLEQNAATQEAKNKFADIQIDLFDKLDNLSRDFGRAIQYLNKLYNKSALAVTRKAKKIIADRNGANQIKAEQAADKIEAAIFEDDNTDSANEALQDLLNNEKEKVKELEAAYEKLKKQITNPTPPRPTSKKRDLGVSIDRKETIKRLKETKYNANRQNIIPVAPPKLMETLTDLTTDYMQEGLSDFEDIQKKLKKDLGGLHSEYYAEAYEKSKEKAVSKGVKETEFTSTEQVNNILDKQRKTSDVAKLAKASERLAKAQGNAPQTVAKRVVNDAKTFLNGETTKKEGELINKLIAKVSAMAKDKYKSKTLGKTSPTDLLLFAIENKKEGKELFDAAQKEVNNIIENDNKLTENEKADLKQFLENYQKSIFDALLTNKNKDLIIKEALVKLGYATQDSKGNIVADLGKIALSKNTPKEAIEKVKEAISNELGLDPSEIDDLLAALETRFNELVQAKKEAKINAVVKANDRYKAATQFSNKARKDKIRSLIELYNAGGLTNDKILEKMARDLGIIAFTDNDQKIIEDLLQRIDNAGIGFVSAGLEEELQAYFEHIGGTFAMKEMFERWRARLLSGFITTGKNLTGFFDTGFMIGHQLIDSNMNMDLLKGNVELNILKVIKQANRIGGTLALESLVNGSVDNGSAFAEQTGQKEGTPSVRFLEFQKYHNYWTPDLHVTIKGVTFNLNPINALKKNEKYVQRVLGATDSVNHTILQEMKSYTFTKRVVMRNNPNMSSKEAAKVAYEIMYNLDITEATAEASKIFQEKGLDIENNKRAFNKLVYKLAQDSTMQAAREQAIQEFTKSNIEYTSKSGKLKLNRRINEITQQQRDIAVLNIATEFASRYTYKQSDAGVFPLVANLIKYVKDVFPLMAARIRKNAKGTPYSKQANKIANGIEVSGELLFTSTMPFINGVANILEKGLEFNPIYGGIKSATYLGLALNANNKKDTAKARELSAKSGEVIYRVAVGMVLMALLQSLADDDGADDEKAIYGQGDKNFNRNKVIETVRPQNTIRIGGRDISFDFFGTLATEMKIRSIAKDLKRYADKEITNTQYMGMVLSQIISSSFTKGLSDIATAASSTAQTGKLATYFEKKAAELTTRIILPFTSFVRQAGQVAEPEAKKAIGLKENIIKQAGVGGWLLNKPNLDYRGRTYDTGELYTSSASGAMNLFGSKVNKDPIDVWVLKAANNNLGISDIKKDSDKFYLVDNGDGTSRPMTDEETYDVSAEAARIFNGLLVDYYNHEKNSPITKISQEQVAKDLSERHNETKKAAFRKIFKGSKNEDKYLEDKFDWLKKDEGKETEIKRAADDIANNVSEETKALRDKLPKDKYDKQIFLAKMLRSIVNKTTTLKQWKEAGIIKDDTEKDEIIKLSK